MAMAVAGLAAGAWGGRRLVRYASEQALRRGALTVALLGATTLVVRGTTALL